MTVPIVGLLRSKYPEMKITIVTTEFFSVLYNQISNIHFLFFKQKHKTFIGLYSLYKEINRLNPDYIVDLHNVLRTKLLRGILLLSTNSVKAHLVLDKGRKEKKELINGSTFKRLKSTHQRYADVFYGLNIKLDLEKFKFYKKIDISNKKHKFNPDNKLIGIAPFARHICKEYSMKNILELIDSLNHSCEILIFGASGNEEKKIKKICKERKNTYNVSSNYSLDEQMAVISNLELLISMDSANGHIASIFGINVITIWGATHPFTGYSPFMQPDINSITPDIKAFPKLPVTIYGSNCPENYSEAINSIKTKTILERVSDII